MNIIIGFSWQHCINPILASLYSIPMWFTIKIQGDITEMLAVFSLWSSGESFSCSKVETWIYRPLHEQITLVCSIHTTHVEMEIFTGTHVRFNSSAWRKFELHQMSVEKTQCTCWWSYLDMPIQHTISALRRYKTYVRCNKVFIALH